jgi:hypothetical protein
MKCWSLRKLNLAVVRASCSLIRGQQRAIPIAVVLFRISAALEVITAPRATSGRIP